MSREIVPLMDGAYEGRAEQIVVTDDEMDQRPEAERREAQERDKRKLVVPQWFGKPGQRMPKHTERDEGETRGVSVIGPGMSANPPASGMAAQAKLPVLESLERLHEDFARLSQSHIDAIEDQRKKAEKQLRALLQNIEAEETRCAEPSIAASLQHLRFERQKIMLARGAELADCANRERDCAADLDAFRQRNGLKREAHYPASHLLSVGVLMTLILVEAGLNGVLFAESSAAGLFGGWMEAIVLAIANVGAAFLTGWLGLRSLNCRSVAAKAVAGLAVAAGVLMIAGLNVFGAHYRDFKAGQGQAHIGAAHSRHEAAQSYIITPPGAEITAAHKNTVAQTPPKPEQRGDNAAGVRFTADAGGIPVPGPAEAAADTPERKAILKAFAEPWNIQSFNGFFLLVIGLCAAALAAFDGYRIDDPHPGYGRRHRALTKAREKSRAALTEAAAQSAALAKKGVDQAERSVRHYASQVQALASAHSEYSSLRKSLEAKLHEDEQKRFRELSHFCRMQKLSSSPACAIETIAWLLPDLPERHAKNLKAKEKVLKALQGEIAAERSKAAEPFAAAAQQFETLTAQIGSQMLQLPQPGKAPLSSQAF